MQILKHFLTFSIVILSLIPALTLDSDAQTSKNYIAKIGDDVITSDQFKTRFEFTPHVGRHIGSVKNEFLYTLIAEKLWAEAARANGLENTPIIASTLTAIKKMFVRDKLYREEILASVVITEKEISEAVGKELSDLEIAYLKSSNEEEIKNLHYLLSSGYQFDSLLSKRPERNEQQNNATLSYSEMNQAVVDSLYNLNRNDFTSPIRMSNHWYIFYLRNKETKIFPNSDGKQSLVEKAKEKLRDDKIAMLYQEYMQNIFIDKNVKVNGSLFRSVAKKYADVLRMKSPVNDTLYLDGNDAYYFTQNISADTLELPFIMLDANPITVGDFILEQSFYGFEIDSYSQQKIENKLNAKIRQFIEYEILAREGFKKGYHNLPDLVTSVKMWEDYYLSYFYKNTFKDSIVVSDEELNQFMNTSKTSASSIIEYNAIELLTADLNIIRVAMNIEDENELRQFVIENTIRKKSKINNGELGWFSANDFPELSAVADQIGIGEIYGPIQVPNGYSLIKLIGKRFAKDSISTIASERTTTAANRLREKKYSELLLKKTVEFANEYKIEINTEKLEQLPTTDINSYLIRVMGFGGTLPAVPLSTPFSDWYKNYIEQEKITL